MTYDLAADLASHRSEIDVIRREMGHFQVPDTGYERCLDIGGGGGFHAPWLLEMANQLIVSDRIDYLSLNNGALGATLKDRFARNGIAMDPGRTSFHTVDARNLIYRDGLFDLVVSINAFEHIPDPDKAFDEVVRVTRPGGTVVLSFDPIWNSALGHHLPHLDLEPWQHLMEDEASFIQSVRAKGGTDQDVLVFQTRMNRRSYREFMDILKGPSGSAFKRTRIQYWSRSQEEDRRAGHPNFATLRARGMPAEELFVRGIQFIGVKKNDDESAQATAEPPSRRSWFRR